MGCDSHRSLHYSTRRLRYLAQLETVAFVGALSYSLHVWQQIFLNRYHDRPYTAFPSNMALTVACALISFYAVERPFLVLRERLKRAQKYEHLLTAS